jgi:LysR family transcriptional regulator for bpeEF and oprC
VAGVHGIVRCHGNENACISNDSQEAAGDQCRRASPFELSLTDEINDEIAPDTCPFMDKLQAMTTFARVVETQSFSKAAQTLSMPRSSVTTVIKNLEKHLGTPLLRRSTRTLSLTDAGERYYASCRAILLDIAQAESGLLADAATPHGRIRAGMPGVLGRAIVLPRLREFEQLFPGIELTLVLSDRPVDLIYDGIDCVIRTGELMDSTLTARRLGQLNWLTCAAHDILKSTVNLIPSNRSVFIARSTI